MAGVADASSSGSSEKAAYCPVNGWSNPVNGWSDPVNGWFNPVNHWSNPVNYWSNRVNRWSDPREPRSKAETTARATRTAAT